MPTVTEYAQYFSEKEKALREKKKKHNDKKEKDTHTQTTRDHLSASASSLVTRRRTDEITSK